MLSVVDRRCPYRDDGGGDLPIEQASKFEFIGDASTGAGVAPRVSTALGSATELYPLTEGSGSLPTLGLGISSDATQCRCLASRPGLVVFVHLHLRARASAVE